MPHKYLKTVIGSVRAVDDILIKEKPVIGVKCFGVNMGEKGGRLSLVAVSTWDGNMYVFDVQVCPAIMYEGGLLRVLQSAELLKVFHNCAQDSAVLHNLYDVRLKNIFDTQIAYSIIMENQGLSARRLTLGQLCDEFKLPEYHPSPELQRLLVEDNNVWARRPCTKELLTTAAAHVQSLVPALFTATDSALPSTEDAWFRHLCEENRLSLVLHRKSGRRSATKCPHNRLPTKSIHLVPIDADMHYCL